MKLRSVLLVSSGLIATYVGCSGGDLPVVGDAGLEDGAVGASDTGAKSDVGLQPDVNPQDTGGGDTGGGDSSGGDTGANDSSVLDAAADSTADASDALTCKVNQILCSGVCYADTSPDHCGSCPHLCGAANAAARGCQTGVCEWKCNANYAHCGKDDASGCETPLDKDPNNCIKCGNACNAGEVCFKSNCEAPAHLPDSKDKKCSNGAAFVPCGSVAVGQDGDYDITPTSFITTTEVAFDTLTGLTWERPSTQNPVSAKGMITHCDDLSSAVFGGKKDWRLPTAREAMTIANMGQNGQGIDQTVFPSAQNAAVITSTPSAANASNIWILLGNYPVMSMTNAGTISVPGSHCVSGPVLSGPTLGVLPSTLSVLDKTTSLQWQRDTSPSAYAWLKAIEYCESLSLDGADDWRLPNAKELWSIVDVKSYNPALDKGSLSLPKDPGQTWTYWSSSPFGNFANLAYSVDFVSGAGVYNNAPSAVANAYSVRCVRGG